MLQILNHLEENRIKNGKDKHLICNITLFMTDNCHIKFTEVSWKEYTFDIKAEMEGYY